MRFVGRDSVTHCHSWCGRPQFCHKDGFAQHGGKYKLIKDETTKEVIGENAEFDFEHSEHWDMWVKEPYVTPPDAENDPNPKEVEL